VYAVGAAGVLLLLVGVFLLTRQADGPLLIVGIICILLGIVLTRISRANRRR
jgi:VIT1/CCC1 family predicted Fe2+/Mn2+ transporter